MISITAPNNISYKDTAARVVNIEGVYYRYIFNEYKAEYDCLMKSGLYEALKNKGFIIPHTELDYQENDPLVYKQLLPEQIHFQTYPFCWSYTQWRKAILTYLEINKIALRYGMILKDATPFNFYFKEGRAILLDTSSFTFLKEGEPWIAYQQFCSEFLSPIALMHYNGQIWSSITKSHIRGLPLNFVSKQLPLRSWFNPTCLMHIHLHGKYANAEGSTQQAFAKKNKQQKGFSKEKQLLLIEMLLTQITKWKLAYQYQQHWQGYYEHDIESSDYLINKEQIIKDWLVQLQPNTVIDLGANTGKFSFMAAEYVQQVIAIESDESSINEIETIIDAGNIKNVATIMMDLAQTTPNMGVLEKEYTSIFERVQTKSNNSTLVMGLAIVHHLYISNYLSFGQIAELFVKFSSQYVIIEFIPIQDSKVQWMIKDKPRNFDHYTQEQFTASLLKYFKLKEVKMMKGTDRQLLLLEKLN